MDFYLFEAALNSFLIKSNIIKYMSIRCQFEDCDEIGALALLTNTYCIFGRRKQPEHDTFV